MLIRGKSIFSIRTNTADAAELKGHHQNLRHEYNKPQAYFSYAEEQFFLKLMKGYP